MQTQTDDDIRQKLLEFVSDNPQTMLALVTDVDETSLTCTLDDDGSEYYCVRLSLVDDSVQSIVDIPKANSYVLAARIEDSEDLIVIYCSEIEKRIITIGDKKLVIDNNGFAFNDAAHGMVKIDKMVEWMQKVYTDLQMLKSLLSTSPVSGNGAVLAITFSPQTENPDISTFEDTTVKH